MHYKQWQTPKFKSNLDFEFSLETNFSCQRFKPPFIWFVIIPVMCIVSFNWWDLAQTPILATSCSSYILATYLLISNSIQCLEYLDTNNVVCPTYFTVWCFFLQITTKTNCKTTQTQEEGQGILFKIQFLQSDLDDSIFSNSDGFYRLSPAEGDGFYRPSLTDSDGLEKPSPSVSDSL